MVCMQCVIAVYALKKNIYLHRDVFKGIFKIFLQKKESFNQTGMCCRNLSVTQQKVTTTRQYLILQYAVIIRIFTVYWLFVMLLVQIITQIDTFPMGLLYQTTIRLNQRPLRSQTPKLQPRKSQKAIQTYTSGVCAVHLMYPGHASSPVCLHIQNTRECSKHIVDMQVGLNIYIQCIYMYTLESSMHYRFARIYSQLLHQQ